MTRDEVINRGARIQRMMEQPEFEAGRNELQRDLIRKMLQAETDEDALRIRREIRALDEVWNQFRAMVSHAAALQGEVVAESTQLRNTSEQEQQRLRYRLEADDARRREQARRWSMSFT